MTALPTIAYLRRHALPAHFLHRLDAATAAASRPRLAARWSLGEAGRPVCRWTIVRDPARAEAAESG